SARSRVDDPVSNRHRSRSVAVAARRRETQRQSAAAPDLRAHYWSDHFSALLETDRKSTRLNSSHVAISYAVFCLKKKKNKYTITIGLLRLKTMKIPITFLT